MTENIEALHELHWTDNVGINFSIISDRMTKIVTFKWQTVQIPIRITKLETREAII